MNTGHPRLFGVEGGVQRTSLAIGFIAFDGGEEIFNFQFQLLNDLFTLIYGYFRTNVPEKLYSFFGDYLYEYIRTEFLKGFL